MENIILTILIFLEGVAVGIVAVLLILKRYRPWSLMDREKFSELTIDIVYKFFREHNHFEMKPTSNIGEIISRRYEVREGDLDPVLKDGGEGNESDKGEEGKRGDGDGDDVGGGMVR